MRKFYSAALLLAALMSVSLLSCNQMNKESGDFEEGYDGPLERQLLEIEKTKDPATGGVPKDELLTAMFQTETMKAMPEAKLLGMNWIERGPIYDSVGPSNGNTRGGFTNTNGVYTSGRMRAVLIDPTDETGNTVWVGGVAGGLWKTTNLLATIPTWQNVNDFFDNMAVSSICIDPTNSNIMYFSTGEPTVNADAVAGMGIWKSTDHGVTWNLLPSTTSFTLTFKLLCDNSGNLYAARRSSGVSRSTNGGASWTTISPASGSAADIELSSTGRMHVAMGYFTSAGNATHYYTDNPATVAAGGWTASTGLPASANRLEIATQGDLVYICPTSTGNNVNAAYKSLDGGATFTKMNVGNYTTGISNTQGWYNISLDINPNNGGQFIVGGLDAYRSLDSGVTVQRMTYWVTSLPYVHADHHYVKWFNVGGETRVLMGTDGGLYLSRDNGATFVDKNRNLGIKQFYSCAIHPSLPDYFLAGAQDNGSHKLNNPGLTYSIEVTGGDGAYVDIDQDEPQYQFTSYVYNQFRRSTNGGNNWSSFNFSNSAGLFINPFDYDDVNNKFFSSYGGSMMRWNNPTGVTSVNDTNRMIIPGTTGSLTAFMVSPNVNKRLYVGTSSGKLFRIENSDVVTGADIADNTTDITGGSFVGYLNCIAVGSNDNHLLAIFSNYGVNNVWYSSNGGASWTGIDGNLPNMPVRWAVFDPVNDDKVIIATEAGVYVARDVNGASTQWLPSADFPTVRTDMLKVRPSDRLILAATHGRGLWSSYTYTVLPVKKIELQANLDAQGNSNLTWTAAGASSSTKFNVQYSINGISFIDVATLAGTAKGFKHVLSVPTGYYRIMGVDPNSAPVYSNVAVVRNSKPTTGLTIRISPNPVSSNANFVVNTSELGDYNWAVRDMQGRVLQTGNGKLPAGGSVNLPINTSKLSRGTYNVLVIQNKQKMSSNFVKQ
ncbi:MAG: T9SS type A sorting domain-containing protein [Sphingobacteriales bacterium]|nr:MAG: T9SS type A sorting domain-containing protein [Sphingobacteriales bacterium]